MVQRTTIGCYCVPSTKNTNKITLPGLLKVPDSFLLCLIPNFGIS